MRARALPNKVSAQFTGMKRLTQSNEPTKRLKTDPTSHKTQWFCNYFMIGLECNIPIVEALVHSSMKPVGVTPLIKEWHFMNELFSRQYFDVFGRHCKDWYSNGAVFRSATSDGSVFWFDELGRLHRKDGPAQELADGTNVWFQEGDTHRVGGPAIEYANGLTLWIDHGRLVRGQHANEIV